MKRFLVLLCMSLLISTIWLMDLNTGTYAAKPMVATIKSLSTNYALVNLGSQKATVNVSYVIQGGGAWPADPANTSFEIPNNFGQKGIAQYFDTMMAPGSGSAVITSNQPLGGVVQILARGQIPTSGAYSGVFNPSNKYYAPQIFKNLGSANGTANSQIIIQNTDTQNSIIATVTLISFPGSGLSGYTKNNISISGGASFTYDLSDEINLSNGWSGSAVISAETGKQIAVVVNSFVGVDSLQAYNAFPEETIANSWVIPMFTSRLVNGLSTPIVFQNLSGVEMPVGDVSMTCQALDASFTPQQFTLTNPIAIPNNGAGGFNPVADTTNIPTAWSGSCRIKSLTNKNFVSIVQMRRPGFSADFAAYEAFPITITDPVVVVPAMSKRQPNGFATAATFINLDTINDAQVTLTYNPSEAYVLGGGSSTPIVILMTIPKNGSIGQNLRLIDSVPQIPVGWFGTLVVAPTNSANAYPVVGIVQLSNYFSPAGDTLMAHTAINLPEVPVPVP